MTQRTLPWLLAVAAWALACARVMPPPGGQEDRQPPQLISISPEPLSVMPGFRDEVVFAFDERISERGAENAILISPATSETKISRGRTEIRARPADGWRPDVIYRVVLLPGIRDLFGNERKEPVELVFSTGVEIPPTALGGLVTDRITGRPAANAIVDATRREDSLRYTTAADSLGFFALRNLPIGTYDLTAYIDQNRNRRRDPAEPFNRNVSQRINGATDTAAVDLILMPMDTTPPRLITAVGRDSLQIRVTTDDWLEPAVPMASVRIRILTFPDSTEIEGPHRAMSIDSFTVMRARADSAERAARAAADTAGGDTAAVRVVPPPARGGARGLGQQPQQQQQGPFPSIGPLPFQEMVIVPARPLPPGEYLIEIGNLMNIQQRPGGGGTQRFEIPRPRLPARDTTDTTAVRDTTDTTGVRDTTDTTGARGRRGGGGTSPRHALGVAVARRILPPRR